MELPLVMGVLLSSQLHSQHQVTIRKLSFESKSFSLTRPVVVGICTFRKPR